MKVVPARPDRVTLRTGDRVRVEVSANRAGYLTVFNIGPSGNLNLLHPPDPAACSSPIQARCTVAVPGVELTPPTGLERLCAIWSQRPLPCTPGDLKSLAERDDAPGSRLYRATRDMKFVQSTLGRLPPDEWIVTSLELNHDD
jgi:hypothetical protein